jgi:ankyrin repeat protein
MTLLLEAKADVNAVDRYGNTALAAAEQRGHLDAVTLLLDAHAHVSERALAVAAATGHTEIVKALVAAEVGMREAAAVVPPCATDAAKPSPENNADESAKTPQAAVAAASVAAVPRKPVMSVMRKPRAPGLG